MAQQEALRAQWEGFEIMPDIEGGVFTACRKFVGQAYKLRDHREQ